MNAFDELIKKVVEDNIKDVEKVVREVREMCACGIFPREDKYDNKCVDCFMGIAEVR